MIECFPNTTGFGSCEVATTHFQVGLNLAVLPTYLLLRTETDPSYSRCGLSQQKTFIAFEQSELFK